jgi:hypothetical protein
MNKRYHYGHTILEHILHAIPQLSNKNLTFNDKCTNCLPQSGVVSSSPANLSVDLHCRQ